MIVTTKDQIKAVSDYLLSQSSSIKDSSLSAALTNVGFCLLDAVKHFEEDGEHPHVTLEISQLPNQLEEAASHCCNTDCAAYCSGFCPYLGKDKARCSHIIAYLDSES